MNMARKSVATGVAGVAVAVTSAWLAISISSTVAQSPPDEPNQAQRPEAMNNERLGELLKQHFPKVPFTQNGANVLIIKPDGDPDAQEELEPERQTEDQSEDNSDDQEPDQEAAAAFADLDGTLMVITDEKANRMRIMMPIQSFDVSQPQDLKTAIIVLHANYDRALDARYAISDGLLWSAFIHPLSSLTEEDLASALDQVRTLRKNTGTSYSSGALQFGPANEEAPAEDGDSEENSRDRTA